MKRCPICHREYSDETLNFCLDDGEWLGEVVGTREPVTEILPGSRKPMTDENDVVTRHAAVIRSSSEINSEQGRRQSLSNWYWPVFGILVLAAAFLAYQRYLLPRGDSEMPSGTVASVQDKSQPFWLMSETEQAKFIRERSRHIETLIGDDPIEIDALGLAAIKAEVDSYVKRKDSLSQKPFEEGLRVIYGRATQYAPLIIRQYESRKIPPTLGLYQAMVESEYRDCDPDQLGHGLFGFSRRTAAKYGVEQKDLCDVVKQSDAAARYMSDLASDFGGQRPNPTLGLLAYSSGEDNVRDQLRQIRGKGITEQNFWVILKLDSDESGYLDDFGRRYVPRFFAAAIIGETPEFFELTTPPLTSLGSGDRPLGNAGK